MRLKRKRLMKIKEDARKKAIREYEHELRRSYEFMDKLIEMTSDMGHGGRKGAEQ